MHLILYVYALCVKLFPQKWVKKDAYLFPHEIPVIHLSPRGTCLSSSTCETVHLDGVTSVRNMSKFFKNNVLVIAFSSSYILLAFESKYRRELWFSEIMYLTGTLLFVACLIISFMQACMIRCILYFQERNFSY